MLAGDFLSCFVFKREYKCAFFKKNPPGLLLAGKKKGIDVFCSGSLIVSPCPDGKHPQSKEVFPKHIKKKGGLYNNKNFLAELSPFSHTGLSCDAWTADQWSFCVHFLMLTPQGTSCSGWGCRQCSHDGKHPEVSQKIKTELPYTPLLTAGYLSEDCETLM